METMQIVSWLYDKAARAQDHSYARMLNATAFKLRELEEKRRWIPVTERLPECVNFLVALANGVVGEAFMMKGDFYWQEVAASLEYEAPLKGVTHWMPLPEPPEEVQP